ncbi:MAG: RNA methyltransferase [Gammaproteobacteria bacterium]|uniref:RNA methyltransferase n=1 Tax=Rhodoferax sp. TaxID=50421 RepID=UPI0018535FDF|nr:RNA methyltransferase [Rhodoferax sp.]MBU3900075.1 RNA methyltransferase [Gammaproteobacteria bacterium]MBA3059750.1 RNA methyltransferase [Rhodoferax sp.]MBU3996527.1 RNA methyltransferase [Gammaproteobacteria bacterium]MBU4018259.1 RNA methyltransferase [Gammaproteobacteria bacterium]MBU4082113.1 RNA methyltransferase [Gammaproteobacteria bacterium]
MQTRFILINTSHAGNVGAAARAMKTMGFADLVLVAPRWANVLNREETIQRASGALDVLKNARIVATLDEALDGMTHLCATAMTPRDFGPPTVTPREHFESLIKKELLTHTQRGLEADLAYKSDELQKLPETAQVSVVAPERGMGFLFGCERFGMRNEDVYRCHVALSIPSDPQFGSLNLGAAVQVIAYEWRLALGAFAVQAATVEPVLADAAQVAGLLAHLEQSLQAIGFLDPLAPKKLMPRLNQLFNRAGVTQEEVHILRGIAKAILQNAAQPGALAPATACVQG